MIYWNLDNIFIRNKCANSHQDVDPHHQSTAKTVEFSSASSATDHLKLETQQPVETLPNVEIARRIGIDHYNDLINKHLSNTYLFSFFSL